MIGGQACVCLLFFVRGRIWSSSVVLGALLPAECLALDHSMLPYVSRIIRGGAGWIRSCAPLSISCQLASNWAIVFDLWANACVLATHRFWLHLELIPGA